MEQRHIDARAMRVLILGAYGFVGRAITRHALARGYDVVGVGRSMRAARRTFPGLNWVSVDISTLTHSSDWYPVLAGCDAVINASGALQSGAKDDVTAVQSHAVTALIEACERRSISRFVQISAPGASASASTEFMRSKAIADTRLAGSTLDWVILRPGLIFGPNAYGGTAALRAIASVPLVQPVVYGDSIVRTVGIEDVATIAIHALCETLPARSDLDLVSRDTRSIRELLLALRRWLGFSPPLKVVDVPPWIAKCSAYGADALGQLGWRSPLRSTALRVLSDGVEGDASALEAISTCQLTEFDQLLEEQPATLQERWFARSFLLLPFLIATLAVFWTASGLIAIFQVERAAAVLTGVVQPMLAQILVVTGSVVDVALGVGVLVRDLAPAACIGMILCTAVYLVAGSFLTPWLWLDPLGVFLKSVPTLMLAMITYVLLEDR